jgi:hypothetical protein
MFRLFGKTIHIVGMGKMEPLNASAQVTYL